MDFKKLELENKIKFIGRTRVDDDKLFMNFLVVVLNLRF